MSELRAATATMESEPVTRRPGRPRSPEADRAIIDTTLELLLRDGLRGLSIETVARRAGVGKNTIYRRHPTKPALVAAAVRSLSITPHALPDTGSLWGDIDAAWEENRSINPPNSMRLILRLMVDSFHDPELSAIVQGVLVAPARQIVKSALIRAKERGEVRDEIDPEQFADLVYGPLVYRALLSDGEVSDTREFVKATLDSLEPWMRA